jgi:hypothetical protein
LGVAAAHVLGEALDAVGVVSFGSEVFAVDVPVGALAGAGCLDVGGLLARLPAAGDDKCVGYGRALRTVDVLRVPETHAAEVIAGECSPAAGYVELDERFSGGGDVEDFSLAAVLDALLPWLVVLLDHCYSVALADAVVDAGHLDFQFAELAALCAVVLCAGVETVDLLV